MVPAILVFYGVSLSLGIAVAVTMWATGTEMNSVQGFGLVLLTMWAPAVGRLVATRTVDRDWVSPLPMGRWGRPRGWVFGWPFLCIVLLYCAVYLVGVLLGWSEWAPQWGGPSKIAINLLVNVPMLFIIMLPGSIGEELGWRGYLQPKLDQAGVRWSVPIVVVLEMIYHLPIMLLGGYLFTSDNLWIIPLFFVAKLGASFVWAHACYAMVSIWPAIWFHTIHNGLSQGIFPKLFTGGDDQLRLGETGLLPALGYLTIAAIILIRMKRAGQSWRDLARGALEPS